MSLRCNRPILTAVALLLLLTLSASSASAQPGRPGFPPGGLQVQTPPVAEYENARVGDKIPITVNGNNVEATVIAVTPGSVSIEYRGPGIRVGRTLGKSVSSISMPNDAPERGRENWNIGDEVLVRRGRDHVPATVVKVSGIFVTVRIVGIDGTEREMKYPSSFLKSPDKAERPPGQPDPSRASPTTPSPFPRGSPGPTGSAGSWVDVLPANGSRLWMDASGKHTMEAVLASRTDSSVSLHAAMARKHLFQLAA